MKYLNTTNTSKNAVRNKTFRWRLVIRWLLEGSALLCILSRFVPFAPPSHSWIIDNSWMEVLHIAFIKHWQFGRDIVFTLGPWGFLYGGYNPTTHLITVIVWTILSVMFWWSTRRVALLCFKQEWIALVWLMAFSIIAGVTFFQNLDVRLIAWILLLLLLHFFAENRSITAIQISLVISLGLLSLIKFSILIPSLIAVLVIAADNIWRYRRFPWIVPLFVASFLFFWLIAEQHLTSLFPFILNSWRITNGFTEAMSLTGTTEMRDVCLFLSAVPPVVALAGYAAWKRHRFFGLLPLTAIGFVGFTAFKYGYIRHDAHELTALMQLLLCALICIPMAWPLALQKGKWALLTIFLPLLFVLLVISIIFRGYSEKGFIPYIAESLSVQNIFAPLKLFQEDRLPKANKNYITELQRKFPVPEIKGSVDVYPWNQAAVLAYDLHYQPRPIIQSYSAYTPELEELNAAFLRTKSAPDNILFTIAPIDNHFPTLDDGRSWPELLTRYDTKNGSTNEAFLLLTKSINPRKYQMVLLKETTTSLGKPVMVPAITNGPIWAEIEINKSLFGDIISTFYKPPILMMRVALHDQQSDFRLIPGMARNGFLLSPFVDNEKSFALLASHDGLNALANLEITSLTIFAATSSGMTFCYKPSIRLRFYHLDYPR